ncbi:cystathionine beta-lyase PatB [Gottschalkia purinilytica]|uniref:cysteine-S-conjugate beta-lyase n=1 Tax=Gottschalkia purinilytica TaxID=1503 RepID=A0A0L0WEX0_GOTPU|nr:PatB family C-S lyase [Gottschalkia purinilytica]KNF10033.1 cystathionine beta-lyase PatB [Gottschalkia purinilytica]
MSKYNFDEIIDRKGTYSSKWDGLDRYFGTKEVLPLWVADTDFAPPREVVDALNNRVQHNIYGYPIIEPEHYEPIIKWSKKRYGYDLDVNWIINTPGVVTGLCAAIQALTKEGDEIIIQSPVYPPFFSSVTNNNRKLVENELINNNEIYEIDFDDLEKKASSGNAKMLVLCNPQNPVGRVWNREELQRVIDICIKNNIIIFSDEIHGDIIYKNKKFNSLLSFSKEYYDNIIVATAPSKTFNVPGLFFSYVIVPNQEFKNDISRILTNLSISPGNVFNIPASVAAYEYGEEWLEELLIYLEDNVDYLIDFVKERLPQVKVVKPEGTYLAWLDFSELFESQEELRNFLINEAKVGLNDGTTFGNKGNGFARLNFGCPRSVLKEGLERIEKALVNRNNK